MPNEPTPTRAAGTGPEPIPCPFCGEIPSGFYGMYDDQHSEKWGGVQCCCQGPDVRTGYGPLKDWRDDAIAAWNRRAVAGPRIELTPIVRHELLKVLDRIDNARALSVSEQAIAEYTAAYAQVNSLLALADGNGSSES